MLGAGTWRNRPPKGERCPSPPVFSEPPAAAPLRLGVEAPPPPPSFRARSLEMNTKRVKGALQLLSNRHM